MTMAIASLVGLWEGAYKENIWKFTMIWNAFTAFFIFVWFHEFILGGPTEPDNMFDNYTLTSYIALGVLGAATAWAGRRDESTSYPITFTVNFIAVVFGFWVSERIRLLHHTDYNDNEPT